MARLKVEAVAGPNNRQFIRSGGLETSLPEGMHRRLDGTEKGGGGDDEVVSGRWLTEDNGSGVGSGRPPDKAEPGEGSEEQSTPPMLSPPSPPRRRRHRRRGRRRRRRCCRHRRCRHCPPRQPPPHDPVCRLPRMRYIPLHRRPPRAVVTRATGHTANAQRGLGGTGDGASRDGRGVRFDCRAVFAVVLKAFYSKRICAGASEHAPSGGRHEHRQKKAQPKPRTTIKVVQWVTQFEPRFLRRDVRPPRISDILRGP